MNIFEYISRSKSRFPSSAGLLTTEQLWDLPLTSKADRPDLDKVAKAVNGALKDVSEDSFVSTAPNPRKKELEVMLEVVKHIIAAKQAIIEAAGKSAATSEQRAKLLAAIDAKETEDLSKLSAEELRDRLARLAA